MIVDFKVKFFDFLSSVSTAIDILNPLMGKHHKVVTYLVYKISKSLNWDTEQIRNVIFAASIHDIGALSIKEWIHLADFENKENFVHTDVGYYFIKNIDKCENVANAIRFHHVPWRHGKGQICNGHVVSNESHLIHMADRISILIDPTKHILHQTQQVINSLNKGKDSVFDPAYVEVFKELATTESFWLDITSPFLDDILDEEVYLNSMELDINSMELLAKVFSKIIDFKSYYTSTHTSGVAAVAESIGNLIGMENYERKLLKISGYLHDIGKLVIPAEILDKQDKLTDKEYLIMRCHTYYTYHILNKVKGLETIKNWASMHHEDLNGTGYPFHLSRDIIPLGAKIIMAADVFTAIAEKRPYRDEMAKERVIDILTSMTKSNKLDSNVINILIDNYDKVDTFRKNAQHQAKEEYDEFVHSVKLLTPYSNQN